MDRLYHIRLVVQHDYRHGNKWFVPQRFVVGRQEYPQ